MEDSTKPSHSPNAPWLSARSSRSRASGPRDCAQKPRSAVERRGEPGGRQATLIISEKALGPDHPHVEIHRSNLLDCCKPRWIVARSSLLRITPRPQGNLTSANPLFERALTISQKAHGPEQLERATALDNLALLLWRMERFSEAIPYQERATQIREGRDETELALRYRHEPRRTRYRTQQFIPCAST